MGVADGGVGAAVAGTVRRSTRVASAATRIAAATSRVGILLVQLVIPHLSLRDAA